MCVHSCEKNRHVKNTRHFCQRATSTFQIFQKFLPTLWCYHRLLAASQISLYLFFYFLKGHPVLGHVIPYLPYLFLKPCIAFNGTFNVFRNSIVIFSWSIPLARRSCRWLIVASTFGQNQDDLNKIIQNSCILGGLSKSINWQRAYENFFWTWV